MRSGTNSATPKNKISKDSITQQVLMYNIQCCNVYKLKYLSTYILNTIFQY